MCGERFLWRGGLPPLERVALPYIFSHTESPGFGAASQPNGGKPPRHTSPLATKDQTTLGLSLRNALGLLPVQRLKARRKLRTSL
ncbi:hypothetical protein PSJE_00905 [Pseudomonas jessenii]|nr:hypothetical protein PSJE_00905 [Pseudomonas jessenii]